MCFITFLILAAALSVGLHAKKCVCFCVLNSKNPGREWGRDEICPICLYIKMLSFLPLRYTLTEEDKCRINASFRSMGLPLSTEMSQQEFNALFI